MGVNPRLPWVTVVVVGIVKDMKQDGLDTDDVPTFSDNLFNNRHYARGP